MEPRLEKPGPFPVTKAPCYLCKLLAAEAYTQLSNAHVNVFFLLSMRSGIPYFCFRSSKMLFHDSEKN